MIVLLNTLAIPLSIRIAEHLSLRYSGDGAFIDLHALPDSQSLENMVCLIPPEAIIKHVETEKQNGHAHIVLNGTFLTPESLRHLRIGLSAYDDEIYAFRLPLPEAVLAQVAALASREELADISKQWADAQEAGARHGDMGYEFAIESVNPEQAANRIWDDIHAPVELVEYQEHWPQMFADEKAQILQAFHRKSFSEKIAPVAVEHIGSTAIPGMAAKPIVDILITVKHLDDAVPCIQPLRELGYAFIDYPQNTDRRFFRKGTPRSHHIHIVIHDGSSALAYLRFRDALRSDADLRQEYLNLKLDSMQRFKHRRALYGERKSALIRRALTP
jgi:GrpB-like predicted nucleotidyltransferase (UPF0157 family)